ncbi:MAG: IS21-like element helper ATPase IstB [Psychrobium sp.]
MIEQIKLLLVELKLQGFLQALLRLVESPDMQALSFEDKLLFLLTGERDERAHRKTLRLIKSAKLKQSNAYVEDIDYVAPRGIDASYLKTLIQCNWVLKHQFLLITGRTGVGKSWLACALANQVIRMGLPVLYKRFGLLIEELAVAHRDGSLPKLRAQLSRARCLVIDDFAMAPMNDLARQDLLELIEDRIDNGALIITSQLPVSQWHEYIGEATIADAIMDRIVHRSHRLDLVGDSMRKRYGLTNKAKAKTPSKTPTQTKSKAKEKK